MHTRLAGGRALHPLTRASACVPARAAAPLPPTRHAPQHHHHVPFKQQASALTRPSLRAAPLARVASTSAPAAALADAPPMAIDVEAVRAARVVVATREACPYCKRAKVLQTREENR